MEMKTHVYQDLWDAAQAVLGEKFIAVNAYIAKEECFQINDLSLHLKKLEKGADLNQK